MERKASDVFLYIPNLVGYLRIVSVLISFYFAKHSWQIACMAYLAGFAGDVVDGYFARAYDQC